MLPYYFLAERYRRAADPSRSSRNREKVIMKRRTFEIHLQPYHRKDETVLRKLSNKKTVTAKIFCPRPLHKFDVIGMIHNAAGIGIFIVDAYRPRKI